MKYQIKSDKGYYSRSMSTGKAIFLDSSEMGYTFTKEDAEKMLDKLEMETGKDLEIVEYKPYYAKGGEVRATNTADLIKQSMAEGSKKVKVEFYPAYDEKQHSKLSEKLKDSLKIAKVSIFDVDEEAFEIVNLVKNSKDVKSITWVKMADGGIMAKGGQIYNFDVVLYNDDEDYTIKEKKRYQVKASNRSKAYDKAKTKYPKPYFVELYSVDNYADGGMQYMAFGGRVDMDMLEMDLELIKKKYPKAKVTYYFSKDSSGKGYVITAKENNKIIYSSYNKMAEGGMQEVGTGHNYADGGMMADGGVFPDKEKNYIKELIEHYDSLYNIYRKTYLKTENDEDKYKMKKFLNLKKEQEEKLKKMEDGYYADGGMMADGGSISDTIAMTILKQLGGINKLVAMTGAYNFVDLGNGVSFKIKNQKANYIKITLNSMDLYDLEVGRIRADTYKVITTHKDVYFDQLKPLIEKATGMYLSLFANGGNVQEENDVFDAYVPPTPEEKAAQQQKKAEIAKMAMMFIKDGAEIPYDKLYELDIDKLDMYEKMRYENLINKGISKEDTINVLINDVEGDYSQLSPELNKYLKWYKTYYWRKGSRKSKFAYGGITEEMKAAKNILGDSWNRMSEDEKLNATKYLIRKGQIEGGREEYQYDNYPYAKGGRVRFQDKVDAISSRLEGTKVPKRLRKDYGATYDKKESEMAAKRIAGSMIKK